VVQARHGPQYNRHTNRGTRPAIRLCRAAGLETFVDVGQALTAIRDGRGYRHLGFSSFEAYCADRWDMRHQNADRLIRSAEVVGLLNPNGFTPNESQARELAPLLRSEPERIGEVWREALETAPNGHVTAAHVATVVKRVLKPIPEPQTRELRPVPLLRFCQDLPTATIVTLILRVAFPDAETALDTRYGQAQPTCASTQNMQCSWALAERIVAASTQHDAQRPRYPGTPETGQATRSRAFDQTTIAAARVPWYKSANSEMGRTSSGIHQRSHPNKLPCL
jgi:hypothetical protein